MDQMDLIVLVILLSITFGAVQGAIPKCCVETTTKFPRRFLRKFTNYEIQAKNGVCTIDAIVLYVKDKIYCAEPTMEKLLQCIQKKRMRDGLKNGLLYECDQKMMHQDRNV